MPRTVLLVQLPIPPLGPASILGNVPLAAAYLKLFAERKGLGDFYCIDIFPSQQANTLGDQAVGPQLLHELMAACQTNPTHLDKYYALQPGRSNGAKRLIVLLTLALRSQLSLKWIEDAGELATLVWRMGREAEYREGELEPHEYAWGGSIKECTMSEG